MAYKDPGRSPMRFEDWLVTIMALAFIVAVIAGGIDAMASVHDFATGIVVVALAVAFIALVVYWWGESG